MQRETLQFVHSRRPPADDLRVFDSLTREFLGVEFTFRVIGSSHFVSAPAFDFYEVSSCEPVDGDDVTTLALDEGPNTTTLSDAGGGLNSDRQHASGDRQRAPDDGPSADVDGQDAGDGPARIRFESGGLCCETVVDRRPLSAFPDGASFDLSYRFGADAVTTVDVGTDRYETYHTYPEFDLALYTCTVFEETPPATGSAAASDALSGRSLTD